MGFITKLLGGVLTVTLLLVSVFFLFSQLSFPSNYKIFLVQSGSMSPSINTGDLVIVKPISKYQKGDIVTFLSKNNFSITHRITEIKNNEFITKGDANQVADQETVDINYILGKVIYTIPRFGYLIMFIKTIPGLMILIVIPSTIIVYQEFVQIKKNFKKILSR